MLSAHYAECPLWGVQFMLSAANKPIMLSVFMLNVIMLSAVMLNVVAQLKHVSTLLAGIGRKYKRSLMFLLASCSRAVVEQLPIDPKFEGLNPAATDIGRK